MLYIMSSANVEKVAAFLLELGVCICTALLLVVFEFGASDLPWVFYCLL